MFSGARFDRVSSDKFNIACIVSTARSQCSSDALMMRLQVNS